jgi:flagellar biosynthesis protein FlhB
MFSMDSLIELVKSVAKTALLFLVGWLVIRSALPDMVALARSPTQSAQALGALLWSLTLKLLAWTAALFALIAALDAAYQRYSYIKKMRMSMRDIKQEMKESEGDPYIKAQRRQMAQEMAQRGNQQAARNANALIVNPTHVAIAIEYDRETCPVPIISAKGEDHIALSMREAAEEAGVPIVRNIPLARDLLARAEVGEVIPSDVFDAIAEVILWAREVRKEMDAERHGEASATRKRIAAPGEDLTRYPDRPWNRSH